MRATSPPNVFTVESRVSGSLSMIFIVLACMILAGLYPSIRAARIQPVEALRR